MQFFILYRRGERSLRMPLGEIRVNPFLKEKIRE